MKIKIQDYVRIYKTINSVLISEGSNPGNSCTFFAYYGAHILREHYKIDAVAVAGPCCYLIDEAKNIIFGVPDGKELVATKEKFHCWVLAEGCFIDFMAPAFPAALKDIDCPFFCSSKMMQKPISEMVQPNYMEKEGDFCFSVSVEASKDREDYLLSSNGYEDLANICSRWYKRPPRKMRKRIQIGDNKGNVRWVSLTGEYVTGAW